MKLYAEIIRDYNLELFVKDIFLFENKDKKLDTSLPFFADGYPGVIFKEAENPSILLPKKKELSKFFLYGQTIDPIEICLKGSFQLIVFQLYPFASKIFFSVDPKALNDDCYDLSGIKTDRFKNPILQFSNCVDTASRIKSIALFLSHLAEDKSLHTFEDIDRAIQIVLKNNGKIAVKALAEALQISERTLQRMFKEYVGISPKKFAKIIQFQTSLNRISEDSHSKMTDVVYENGYADQSHFIRNIKAFTGKKPSQLKAKK